MAEGTMLAAEVFRQRLSNVSTEEGWLRGQNFQPRRTDVLVTGTAKSGMTWLQQIIHQLSTGGDMDIEYICQAVPVVEFAHDLQIHLEAEQKGCVIAQQHPML